MTSDTISSNVIDTINVSNLNTGKEYVSEVSQNKLSITIRLQNKDGQENTVSETPKPPKNSLVEDSKLNDVISNQSGVDSAALVKGVRKSARLMSQIPKTTIEDTIEDVIKTTADKNLSKRITRSNRRSDDNCTNDIADDQEGNNCFLFLPSLTYNFLGTDVKNGSQRPYRITRSRGAAISDSIDTTTISNHAAPTQKNSKKSSETMSPDQIILEDEILEQPPAIIDTDEVLGTVAKSPKSIQNDDEEDHTDEDNVANIAASISTDDKKIESPSVIQSTGNVEKLLLVVTTCQTPSCTSTNLISSTVSVITTAVSTPSPASSFSSSMINSPNFLQDIPNISERIHQSSTALKLKTGKGFYFDTSSAVMHSNFISSDSTQSSPFVVSTPSVITPPLASTSPKVSEAQLPLNNSTSTVSHMSPTLENQSVSVKLKYQTQAGQPLNQPAEVWPGIPISVGNKTFSTQLNTSSVVNISTTASSFSETTTESSSIIQPPVAHLSKLTPPPNDQNKVMNIVDQSMPTNVLTIHQVPISENSNTPQSAPTNLTTNNKSVATKPTVVQLAGVSQPPELPHIGYSSNVPSGQLNPEFIIQQQKEYLSTLQKQQQILSQSSTVSNTRTVSKDPSSGFVSPSSHLTSAELQQTTSNQILTPPFSLLPPHMRPPVSSAASPHVFVPGTFPISNDLGLTHDIFARQQLIAMYNNLQTDPRNPANIRPPLALPRFLYPPGFQLSSGLTPEMFVAEQARHIELTKEQQKIHEEISKQKLLQNTVKKDDLHRQQLLEESLKHLQEQSFQLDIMGPPSTGQRTPSFSPNLRNFPNFQTPDRFGDSSLMHQMLPVNGQTRNIPLPAHGFSGATDLTKLPSQSMSTEPAKRSPSLKPSIVEPTYLPQVHRQQLPSPGTPSSVYRKDLPTVQEPTADMIRSQITTNSQFHPKDLTSNAMPLNMSSHVAAQQRQLSRSPSQLSELPNVDHSNLVKRPLSVHNSISSDAPVNLPTVHSIPNPISPYLGTSNPTSQPASTPPRPQDDGAGILLKYPVLWTGVLALKNDLASVQMHFVSGSRSLTARALHSFSDSENPLRITQRMRIDQTQLQALERKIGISVSFIIIDVFLFHMLLTNCILIV